jgi:hypothetical protein
LIQGNVTITSVLEEWFLFYLICMLNKCMLEPDSSVSIAMGYGLDSWGLIPSKGKRFFSTSQHPDWL